ncbi:hypothetical protein F2P81_013706 [Scophthalmus maximus]|uniref:Uncharacterized protein n=1 Tax=Scophthalmus maximus TaxID=52904 RepID=A0A6A4SP03_SCOMX|nr:hypothetical protein F2P81_013706 [Scophthalmus maximus]
MHTHRPSSHPSSAPVRILDQGACLNNQRSKRKAITLATHQPRADSNTITPQAAANKPAVTPHECAAGLKPRGHSVSESDWQPVEPRMPFGIGIYVATSRYGARVTQSGPHAGCVYGACLHANPSFEDLLAAQSPNMPELRQYEQRHTTLLHFARSLAAPVTYTNSVARLLPPPPLCLSHDVTFNNITLLIFTAQGNYSVFRPLLV